MATKTNAWRCICIAEFKFMSEVEFMESKLQLFTVLTTVTYIA